MKEQNMCTTINVDGITYTRLPDPAESVKRIVVLQRGWVVVGDMRQDGPQVCVENASVVRIWGSAKGLGEIAAGGPTKNTVLDPCGTVRAHELAIVMTIDCDADKW